MNNSFKTLSHDGCDEFTEKRSRFIGYARPVQTEAQALSFIAEIKQKHWDAKHNVYAYRLREGGIKRYSDDGEPQGTAGMPVLNVLEQEDVTDCAVVVTRYFGGILLGGGGLVRAYSHAAKIGIDSAGIKLLRPWSLMTLDCDYTYYSKIESLVRDCGGVILDTRFTESVSVDFRLPQGDEAGFEKRLADAANGKVRAVITGTVIA